MEMGLGAGEPQKIEPRSVFSPGLSPLARGTLTDINLSVGIRRFIPAGAGNTIGDMCIIQMGPVYPRWRGEHINNAGLSVITRGLSPLARGTQNWAAPFCN